jgi:hypothetical protein
MNAPATFPLDDIAIILGEIPTDEYTRRAKLRRYRNAACTMIATAKSDHGRQLAWTAIEWASSNLYSPAPPEWLDKVNGLCRGLLLTAMQAEDMALEIAEAAND